MLEMRGKPKYYPVLVWSGFIFKWVMIIFVLLFVIDLIGSKWFYSGKWKGKSKIPPFHWFWDWYYAPLSDEWNWDDEDEE
jgi:hypothetical protein